MLIYGDPQFETDAATFARTLTAQLEGGAFQQVEFWRTTLVRAGQFEQGIEDLPGSKSGPDWAEASRHLTEVAAKAFYLSWTGESRAGQPIQLALDNLRRQMADALVPFLRDDGVPLKIKVPEGYEFYALYPEQYCMSAQRWAAAHREYMGGRVLVVGVRSIGTSLSAAVKTTLMSLGWHADRLTVRPRGDPFNRVVNLGGARLDSHDFALIVDEGPGISGSSMAAAAVALRNAGIKRIFLFPGHEGEPGSAAADWVREIWRRFPRLFTPLEEVTWDAMSWADLLSRESSSILARPFEGLKCIDVSAGAWRQFAFSDERKWPALAATFERRKLLVQDKRAGGVCWKFSGLGCLMSGDATLELDTARTRALADAGFIRAPLAACNGFVASRWIEGPRLEPVDANDPKTLEHLGRYIAASTLRLRDDSAVRDGFSRLESMLTRNVESEFGKEAGSSVADWSAQLRPAVRGPAYGDGRMAPYEWVRTADGALLKTDFTGHLFDHTMIGPQSWVWDLAGTVVEWSLAPHQTGRLLEVVAQEGLSTQSEILRFFVAAYAASRLAILWAGASQGSTDPAERQRLDRARHLYRRALSGAMANQGATLSART